MKRAKQSFGGDWTQEKLERVSKYLSAYTTITACVAPTPKAGTVTDPLDAIMHKLWLGPMVLQRVELRARALGPARQVADPLLRSVPPASGSASL